MNRTDELGAAAVYASTNDVPTHETKLVNGVLVTRQVTVPIEQVPHRDEDGITVPTLRG